MRKDNSLIQKIFPSYKVDGILITNLHNIRLLTRFSGSSAYLLLTSKKSYFITDFRYKIQSKLEVKGKFTFVYYSKELLNHIVELIKKNNIKKLGVEEDNLSYKFSDILKKKTNVKFIHCSDALSYIRQTKTDKELILIQNSLKCAERAFQKIIPIIKPGIKEKDLAVELEYHIRKLGAEDIAFPTIVASGKRSALPHANPSNKKLKKNEFIIFDFGAKKNGYNSDITYTVNLNNKKTILTKAYKTVKQAVEIAVGSIKINNEIPEIDQKIDQFIKDAGFKNGLIHSLGHGVGLEIHEAPTLSRNKNAIFKEGMIFTIEPGIYLEDIGGVRLEIMAYLSQKGIKILNSPKYNPINL